MTTLVSKKSCTFFNFSLVVRYNAIRKHRVSLANIAFMDCNEDSLLLPNQNNFVFNMAVSNTDDHLRNHGFILKKDGWHLSPLYDVNPVPEGDELSLCVNEDDATISLDLAFEIAPYCGIAAKDVTAISTKILGTVRDHWQRLATECGLGRGAQEYMRPAFSLALE